SIRRRPPRSPRFPYTTLFRSPEYFEYAGAAGGFIDRFGYPFCRGRIFEHLEKDKGQYDDEMEIFWASGACMAIRKDIFYEVGARSEEHTSELQSRENLVCRLL